MVAPKREKMACQRSMAQKKREREGGNHVSKKKRDKDDSRERTNALRSRSHPFIHPSIQSYTCTFWSRLHDLFLHGSSLWIYNIWNARMPCSYPTFELHKGFLVVGKTEGRYCPDEDNKSWVPRVSQPGNFAMFSKISQKSPPDGLRIYEKVSTTLCTVLTLNSPRQGDS